MDDITITVDDRSIRGHVARCHIDGHGVTIGVTHTTYDEGDQPNEEGWNVHLDRVMARRWLRAALAALGEP